LGFIIVKDILTAHGGEITLADSGADGTTFFLDLKNRGAPALATK
jgi:signal transduction histidine kinase